MKQIKISKGSHRATCTIDRLPELCLHLTGGGWTPAQTARAMLLQSEVLAKGVVTHKDLTIEVDEDEDVDAAQWRETCEGQKRAEGY